jgi:hypothetical protein
MILLCLLPAIAAEITLTPKDGGEAVRIDTSTRSEVTLGGRTYAVEPDEESATLAKARRIVVPILDFENTSVEEAVDYLRLRAAELEKDGKVLNFVTKDAAERRIPRLFLREASVHDILGFIAELAHVKVEYRDAAIVISGR